MLERWLSNVTGNIAADRAAYAQLPLSAQHCLAERVTLLETRDLSVVAAVLPTVGALISTTVQEPWQTLP